MKKIILVEKKQYIEVLDEDENCCSKNCENFTKVAIDDPTPYCILFKNKLKQEKELIFRCYDCLHSVDYYLRRKDEDILKENEYKNILLRLL